MSTKLKATVNAPFDIETEEKPFGKRWGGQTINLTKEDLTSLQSGKLIALDVMNEYVIYLKLDENTNNNKN